MPFPLSSLFPRHPNRVTPRSSPNPRSHPALFFPPGGHTHDRHTIPTDRLHISLSDPVLVAAEKRLSSVPGTKQLKRSIIKDAGTIKTTKPGYLVLHLDGGNLFQTLSVCDDGLFAADTANPSPEPTDTQGTNTRYGRTTWVRGAVELGDKLLDPLDDHCDISEVMMIASTIGIDGSLSDADGSAPDNSRYGSDLAPLASELFKEELYARGYVKRPSNVARKSRTGFLFASRNVFPKVLGRHQGRKVAECLRAGQNVIKTVGELDRHDSEKKVATSVASATLRFPYTESPGSDTNTSASESFDLHEFSYITAFTTPPSSPSVPDAMTLKKGVSLDDSKHAV